MELPSTVHGVILTPEDTDKFKFMGKEGEEIVIEVKARRINSPLDALVRLTDSSGKVLEWNDDFPARNTGLLTHHADSRMQTKLPGDGQYGVQISDTQGHGGEAYVYSLYIGPKRPGFELYMTPSGAGITAGGRVPITVHAIRRDGFNGEIQLSLEGDSRGFKLEGGVIPGGRDSIRLTLSAPMNMTGDLCDLRMTGMARIAGKIVEEPVIPAEDMMQAFAYMHLVPSREFLVAFAKNRRMGALIGPAEGVPIRIPEGGRTPVRMKIPLRARMGEISLELADPPKGIHVRDVALEPGYLAFVLCADAEEGPGAGYADNLIVEAFMKQEAPRPGAGNAGKGKKIEGAKNRNAGKEKTERGDRANRKNSEQNDKSGDVPAEKKKSEPDVPETVQTAAVQKRPVSLGVLPAIPFEIVRP